MANRHAHQKGYLLLSVIFVFFAIGMTVLLSHAAMILSSNNRQFTTTQATIGKINDSLVNFVTINKRLPCPAQPNIPASDTRAGFPDADSNYSANTPPEKCLYPNGIVPWAALGLSIEDITDAWGRLISYRVYDGKYGFHQFGGASALNCDTNNETTLETPPSVTGLCAPNYDTTAFSFISHSPNPTYQKGLVVNDFGRVLNDVAFILISHGPSGLGGFHSGGAQLPMPEEGASDYPNTQVSPTIFVKQAYSDTAISSGAPNHFDDVVGYVRIGDLLMLAKQSARDWPETPMPGFATPEATENLTSPSTDPLKPHFMTSGAAGSGQEFTKRVIAANTGSVTELGFGQATGSYAGCLWWPVRLALTNGSERRLLVAYMEFAAVDDPLETFPGFTMGFLSGSSASGPPTNSTCGTSIALKTKASAESGQSNVVVGSTTGLQIGMNVLGAGIDPASRVAGISGNTVTLDKNTVGLVSGDLEFSDSIRIGRDLGWAGGTLATNYPNRFAIEFDANSDTGYVGPPVVPSAEDPVQPHLAIDYDGVVHGFSAESCVTTGNGSGCNGEITGFPSISKTVTGIAGGSTVSITDISGSSGVILGMSVSGSGIASGVTVTDVTDNVVTLSSQNIATFSGTLTFAALSTTSIMQNDLTKFHGIRTEIYPDDCMQKIGSTGLAGSLTISIADPTQIASGMSVYGQGIANGATVSGITGTTITLTKKNTGTVSGKLIFAGISSPVTSATGISGQNTVLVSAPAGITLGMKVSGSGIGSGVTVTEFAGSTITLSASNISSVSGDLAINSSTTTATGATGQNSIAVADTSEIAVGMIVSGTGIGSGVTVVSLAGEVITLSAENIGTVSGTIRFSTPAPSVQTLVKAWILSNSACIGSPITCAAFQNINAKFTKDVSFIPQGMYAVSCTPSVLPTSVFDSLYFGITTANKSTSGSLGNNVLFRNLFVTNSAVLP